MEDKAFDYSEAMAELERIAVSVEDPSAGFADMEKYVSRSDELIGKCREYLRSVREKVEKR